MDSAILEALRSVIQEELQPVKQELGTVKNDMGSVKQDMGSVMEDFDTLKEDLGTLKEQAHLIREQLDRMEANQNDDVIALLQHIDGKLTNFRNETQANFKTLSRRITAIETDLSETMVEVEALKRKQPQV